MLCLNGLRLTIFTIYNTFDTDGLSMLVDSFKGNTIFHTGYQMSALRIECYQQLVFLWLWYVLFRTLIHATFIVVTWLFRLAIYWENTRVQVIPCTEEDFRHILIIEIPGVLLAKSLRARVEVEHPSGVGT